MSRDAWNIWTGYSMKDLVNCSCVCAAEFLPQRSQAVSSCIYITDSYKWPSSTTSPPTERLTWPKQKRRWEAPGLWVGWTPIFKIPLHHPSTTTALVASSLRLTRHKDCEIGFARVTWRVSLLFFCLVVECWKGGHFWTVVVVVKRSNHFCVFVD